MKQTRSDSAIRPPWSRVETALGQLQQGLRPFHPRLRDRRFWAVQALILGVAGIHGVIEELRLLQQVPEEVGSLSSVPIALFFVPVVYAALNFGMAGTIPTLLWCAILAVPNVVVYHHGAARLGELFQLGTVVATGIFVGQRVDRESKARQRAETASAALCASERKYRGLFESSPAAILVLDHHGVVREANPAASSLFRRVPASLKGLSVADLVGAKCAEMLLNASENSEQQDGCLIILSKEQTEFFLEPAFTRITDSDGKPVIQVLMRDVTEERQRQAGLRAYAASILRAQEEERKRIAHELHDEIVQQVILLCRELDAVESQNESRFGSTVDGLAEARRSAEDLVTTLRDFARRLRPPMLDDLGLVACVRRLLVELTDRGKLAGQLHVVGEERRLPADLELGVFRIAQEALRNVERHAQARRVSVTLCFAVSNVSIEVSDDGSGFALPASADFAALGHLGLLGMRERAEELSGNLTIHSSPGAGTKVTVVLPIILPSMATAGSFDGPAR